jgi:hypothetical protein
VVPGINFVSPRTNKALSPDEGVEFIVSCRSNLNGLFMLPPSVFTFHTFCFYFGARKPSATFTISVGNFAGVVSSLKIS